MSDLLQLAIYNPAILKDEDFLAGFVARRGLFDDIMAPLQGITPRSLAKHRLILGQRGMGKTSLLRRIALGVREDPKLSEILLPLTFREEQYNVHNLHTFWCNCLDALGDFFERTGQQDKAQELDKEVATLTRPDAEGKNQNDGESSLAALKGWAKREGKRPLLLLDNIDLILDGIAKDHWTLRRTLQEAGGIVVIGAAAAYLEATADPKGAFYDFFQITVLERLGQAELLTCLRRLAIARGAEGEKVISLINNDPGRIRTLYDLTGGNPRTLVLLYLLLERDAVGDVMSDLERLLDQVTVLYKSRVEDLPPQARVVLDAMALAWNPIIAADLSTATGMDTSAVSSHLDRLQKTGVVEKVRVSTTKRAAFQLGERFFNIWYLMRHGPRRQRSRLRWLTGFLRGFYSPAQLVEKATILLKQTNEDGHPQGHFYLALSEAVEDRGLRNLLGQEARKELESQAAKLGKRLDELVDPEELPTPHTAGEWFAVGFLLHDKLERFTDAEAAYRRAVELAPRNAAYWLALGSLLFEHPDKFADAATAFCHVIDLDPKIDAAWVGLGVTTHLVGNYKEAETAYLHAIELNSKNATPYFGLAILLTTLGRHGEAEATYRRAIAVDPNIHAVWVNLGDVLASHLKQHDDAEQAYRRAMELDPKDITTWRKLGDLSLYFLGKPEIAELAYREILLMQPENLVAASSLLAIHLTLPDRQIEAEAEFKIVAPKVPPECANWLRVIRALAQNNFTDATHSLEDVMLSSNESVARDYTEFYVLTLRLAAQQGFGEKLLAWLDDQGLGDRYWPLRAAYDAYLHGEERLMDVNPEVRGAAKSIYDILDYPRRYKNKSLADKAPSEKRRQSAKPESGRQVSRKTGPSSS